MYAAVIYIGMQNSGSVQPVVVVERTVFYRERAAGMYSAFPYAFGQVICVTLFTIVVPSLWTWRMKSEFFWPKNLTILPCFFAGRDWISLYLCPDFAIWSVSLFNDWIWVDCCQVPLVPVLHVLHTALLHVLWHDGRQLDSERKHSSHRLIGILQHLEPLLRVSNPPTCK